MIKQNLMRAGLLLAVVLTGLGVRVSVTDQPPLLLALGEAGKTLDAELGDRMETLLRSDAGLTGSRLRVEAEAGVATVRGTVPDEQSLQRALDLAAGVRGAREIRNGMEIGLPKE